MTWSRVLFLVALAVAPAAPAAAQMQAMPVYFSPKGGTGISLNADFGRVSTASLNGVSASNHPTAIGGRVYVGVPFVTVGIGASVYDVNLVNQRNATQYMGSAALKIFGGPLIPVAVSLQGGAGYLKLGSGTGAVKTLSVPVGVGLAINIPTPGASLEPWVGARMQLRSVSTGSALTSGSSSRLGFGLSGGINLGLPMGAGLHVGVDWLTMGGNSGAPTVLLSERQKLKQLVVGVGLHYVIRLPGVPIVPGI